MAKRRAKTGPSAAPPPTVPMPGDDEPDAYTDVEVAAEALPGDVSGSGSVDELASGLLEMCGLTTKLAVLLDETDEDDFRAVAKRLRLFRSLVDQLPTKPRRRRTVGFRVDLGGGTEK